MQTVLEWLHGEIGEWSASDLPLFTLQVFTLLNMVGAMMRRRSWVRESSVNGLTNGTNEFQSRLLSI